MRYYWKQPTQTNKAWKLQSKKVHRNEIHKTRSKAVVEKFQIYKPTLVWDSFQTNNNNKTQVLSYS